MIPRSTLVADESDFIGGGIVCGDLLSGHPLGDPQ